MRLLLVDDNPLYIEALKGYLQDNCIEVLGIANDGLEALAKVEMLKPDMIIMDVQMAGCDGIEATRIIKRDFPDIEIVMLTVSEEDEHLFSAIQAGASGYLLKGMEAQHFLVELRRLAAGEAVLAPGMARRILREFAGRDRESRQEVQPQKVVEQPALSARQSEVLKLLAQGLTYREIGAALDIREITVRYHINEILGKFHLANRTQLIAHASRFNL